MSEDAIGVRLRELFRVERIRLVRFLRARLGSEAEAQDVAQDAIFRLYQRRSELLDRDLRALLFVAARNIATDRLRARQRAAAHPDGDAVVDAWVDEAASPERIVAAQQQLAQLRQLLQELPPRCEYAFVCYKFEGLEYREIAARMAVTESMVRKYVLRALHYCATRLEGAGDTP
ncbi:RNA polymerase sigma-70 factor, ECF subfamily [Steroidobacter denitrificans]|uniref:RNA polymerase sigma-70 factor, ECF subfamily n=1 Tax=Steroidobacter denitrificans TaxID=465721 RepID=A0A127FDT0_STEDE|nr:RNA polymerase sigma-70 factor, ECF subfamily [Steroidobacter denitrificans]